MKSFAVKRDENDPRWKKFKDFLRKKGGITFKFNLNYYGLGEYGIAMGSEDIDKFDRIITLDEWEAEFMQPKLAGREYDYSLLEDFKNYFCQLQTIDQYRDGTVKKYFNFEEGMMKDMVDGRYQKQDRISEIKAEIEKLSNELKELEG